MQIVPQLTMEFNMFSTQTFVTTGEERPWYWQSAFIHKNNYLQKTYCKYRSVYKLNGLIMPAFNNEMEK